MLIKFTEVSNVLFETKSTAEKTPGSIRDKSVNAKVIGSLKQVREFMGMSDNIRNKKKLKMRKSL